MKDLLYPVAIATLILVSCGKETVAPVDNVDPVIEDIVEPVAPVPSLNASFEELQNGTKADMNGSNQLVWAGGDLIGVYVNNDWPTKNQPFHLDGAGGTTSGTFIWEYESGNFTSHDATVAYFPWHGTNGVTDNNVYEGTLYYKMKEGYYDYTSGAMLTPLVATMSYDSGTGAYNTIHFKHAGAAVKVYITNLPAYAKSIGMTVSGTQIWGNFHINPANAGADAMSLDAAADASKNTVWLNFTNATESAFTFLFPVPELTTPDLYFQMYDIYGVRCWVKDPPAQYSINRAQVLVMPTLTISSSEYYSSFTANSTTWRVKGSFNGDSSWSNDTALITDGTWCIAKGLVFAANDKFKLVFNNGGEDEWCGVKDLGDPFPATVGDEFQVSHNEGSDIKISSAGMYDIIFNTTTYKARVVPTGTCPYPAAK